MIHDILKNIPVVLASASPRRAQLFELLGLQVKIHPADIAEPLTDEAPQLQAMQHARNKAAATSQFYSRQTLIVAADTVVAIDEHILGKPLNTSEAARFLHILSGHKHSVFTGVCLRYSEQEVTRFEHTKVQFAPLSEAEIDAYIKTQEPMDKAGAYGIQGYGAQFITGLEGCYFNVMGFPIRLFYDMLKEIVR